MNHMIDNRPDWRKPKYVDTRIDLSNNLCYDSVLQSDINSKFKTVEFNLRQYTDEYQAYEILTKHYSIPISNIAIGFGIGEMIQRFFKFCNGVAIVSPTWSMTQVFAAIENLHYELIDSPCRIDSCDTLYVSSINGITGKLESAERILDAAKYYTTVIVDEAYIDWSKDCFSLYGKADNIVVLRTLSKSLSIAGARFNYAFGSEEIIRKLQKYRPSCCSHSFILPVLDELLELKDSHVSRMLRTKTWIESTFDTKETHGNFVIFNDPPSNLEIFKTKGNRMSLCDLELARCLA